MRIVPSTGMAAAEVLTHLAAGDHESAAEALIRAHGQEVLRWLHNLFGSSSSEADEVFSEVSLRVVRHLAKVDQSPAGADRRLRAWLFRIARREAYRHWARRARRREERLETREAALLHATGPGLSTNLRDREEREKRVARLEAILAELRPQDATLILLRFREEYSSKEIARRLSTPNAPLSEATVRQRILRATRRLEAKVKAAGIQ